MSMVAVFLSAGIMQWVESEILSTNQKVQCPSSGCLDFFDAFYYIIVTVSSCLVKIEQSKITTPS